MAGRPAAGGGQWVEVDPGRLPRWLAGFEERHGTPLQTLYEYGVSLAAPDGALAELHSPPGGPSVSTLDELVTEAQRPRRLGLVLARRGAVAVGVADGEKLLQSKVDSSYVQGRTAAGGWSQQRFARRRDNQAKAAAAGAADIVARLLLPVLPDLDAVVVGGDRRAVDAVLDDPRLGPVAARRVDPFLDVGEPKLAVLQEAVRLARAVRIRVHNG
jgi:hypothetical protein